MITIEQFVDRILLTDTKTETEKCIYLIYFFGLLEKKDGHSLQDILTYFTKAKLSPPNSSRLNKNLNKDKRLIKKDKLFFINAVTNKELKEKLNNLLNIKITESHNEILTDSKFDILPNFKKMVIELNAAYSFGIYDGCEVLMRRVFENLLIVLYEKLKIQNQIQDNKGVYFELNKIINNAITNPTLKLSRSKFNYKDFIEIFNTSAHNRYYMATESDIDKNQHKYSVAIEELLNKIGEI